MKVVIIGATGLIGNSLYRDWTKPEYKKKGWEISGSHFGHPEPGLEPLDMRGEEDVKSHFDQFQPEVVVIAAANPFVDYCETHKEETRALNVDATLKTAQIAAKCNAKVVFFSSEYVFSGRKTPYDEKTKVNPLSEYGRQKVEVEQWMESNLKDYLILRVCGVYGWALPSNRKNFVMQVLNSSAHHNKVLAAKDVSYNPTYAPNLGPVLAELMEKNARGIFHTAGEQALSRYDFAVEIVDAFALDRNIIEPVSYETLCLKQAAKRPQYASFNTEKIQKTVKARLWAPRRALEHMKQTEKEWND